MIRTAVRAATGARPVAQASTFGKRFASTSSARSGTFKGTVLRWGLAGAIIYYYNTSPIFADEPKYARFAPPETPSENETYSTIDAIAEQRRAQARSNAVAAERPAASGAPTASDAAPATPENPEELEQEAEQQGAFNEETGEINWDCPCLGGMAHGVCGEQFRAAFSCFVYSKEEPKGVDCIEHFKAMQNCFREHPDIYGSELDDDELNPEGGEAPEAPAQTPAASDASPAADQSTRETTK